jgi:hypothetical protein
MSDQPPTTSGSEPADPQPSEKKKKPKRTWAQRFKRLALFVIVIALLVRLAVAVAFPIVLRRVAAFYNLDCSYDRLELSMLSGDAGLWHLTFTPKGQTEPIFNGEYVRGDISVLDLFRGRLDVWRVEADGVTVLVDRNPDGSIPLLKLLAANSTGSAVSAVSTASGSSTQPPQPINLAPPLRMDALRLTHIRARIRDKAVSPPLDATFTLNLRLSNLGAIDTPVHFSVDLDADPILDALHVEGLGHADAKSIDAQLTATVDGLRLRPLEPYLRALGLLPIANELSLKAAGELKVVQSPSNPTLLGGSLTFDGVSAIADGEEAAGLDHFALNADELGLRSIKVSSISIDEARLKAGRTAGGRVRFAGIELIGVPPTTQPAAAPTPGTPLNLPAITLGSFDLKHLHAGFDDAGIAPAVSLGVEVSNVSLKNLVLDPSQPDAIAQLSGELAAPGLFTQATFKGTARPFAATKTVDLALRANGIAPSALKPYFDALGIESRLHNASFSTDLSADASLPAGGVMADLKLSGIKLADGGDLFALNQVTVSNAGYQFSPAAVHVGDIEVAGPVLSVDHQASGALAAVGFALKPRSANAVATAVPAASAASDDAPAPAVATTAPAPLVIPSIQLDHFAWKGIDIHYSDESINPPAATELSDAGVELANIHYDGSQPSAAAAPTTSATGTIQAWAKVPNLVGNFRAIGTVSPFPAGVAASLHVTGKEITASMLAPYLRSIGIEPTLHQGSFNADLAANLSSNGISVDAEKIQYLDGDSELAGVDAFKVGNTSLSSGALNIGPIQIDRPRISVSHGPDGAFALMGLRLLPSLFKSPDGTLAPTPTVASASPSTAPASGNASPLPFDVALKQLDVKNATLNWADSAPSTAVQTSAVANLSIANLNLGKNAGQATLHADAQVAGSIDSAAADGTLNSSFDSPGAMLNIAVQGIRAGSLAAYLPPGLSVPMQNGQFHTTIETGITKNPKGGIGAKFIVSNLDYRDQGRADALAQVGSFRVIASRIDPERRIFAVDEISSDGVQTAAQRTSDGAISLLGIALKQVPSATPATQPVAVNALPVEAPAAASSAPSSVAALMAQARQAAPLITVKNLDLKLKQFTLTDQLRPAAAPLVLSDLRFRNMAPVNWGGKDGESHPPTPFRMDCTLDPVIGAVTLTTQVAPLATVPTLSADLTAADINGAGLTALVPEIKDLIDGSSLNSGIFHAHADLLFHVNRKNAWQIDVSRGFATDLDIKDVAYRASPNGKVLAGVDDIHSDGVQINPNAGNVHVKILEITNLVGKVTRQNDGVHLLGLVVKLPTAAAKGQATSQPTTEVATTAPSAPAPAPVLASVPPTKPTSEIRVDQLLISGVDFVASDETLDPPLIVPINSLDVEVRDFTTLAPYEDKTMRFNALVSADKVPILPRDATDSHSTTQPMEHRELFAQASANGQLSLYPQPHGWIKTSLSGLELGALRGAAKAFGVTLTAGSFDSTADAKLPGDGQIHTSSRFVATDLSLSEPPQGPLFRLLKLPAPLDVVIGALQDQEGSITVPIDVPVPMDPKNLSVGTFVGPALGAFTSIIVTAVASAPLKAAGALGDVFGMGGNKELKPEPPVVLPFDPGNTDLSSADRAQIIALVKRLKDDDSLNLTIRHDLGGGDLSIANQRANPSAQDALYLAGQIRQQQLNLLQQRSNIAGTARAQLAWGSGQLASTTIEQLRTLDQQAAANDDAMDRLYGILKPGADRQASRRTRGACLEYGRERLDAVKQAFAAAGLTNLDRVHFANAKFAQATGDAGGQIVITLVPKTKG